MTMELNLSTELKVPQSRSMNDQCPPNSGVEPVWVWQILTYHSFSEARALLGFHELYQGSIAMVPNLWVTTNRKHTSDGLRN